MGLSREAAAFVDAQVAAFAHKIGPAAPDRLVAEATARFMPAQAAEDAAAAAEGRHVTFHHDQVSFNGTTRIEAELDLADALDLDAALTRGAETLKAAGSEAPLDVRRAMAAGDLARRQLALDLAAEPTDRRPVSTGSTERCPRPQATKPRQVVLYVHLSEAAITGTGDRASSWPGSRTATRSSPPTRSGPGAPTPTPRSSSNPSSTSPSTSHHRLRGPRPPRRADRPARPHLRLPLVHPPRPTLRPRPRHPPRPRRARRPRARATSPPLPTTSPAEDPRHLDLHASNPAPTCGRAPTATSSSATTPAPSTSPAGSANRSAQPMPPSMFPVSRLRFLPHRTQT